VKRATKVSLGLFATWAISDLEELWTMSRSSRVLVRRVPRFVPLPESIRRNGFPPAHVAAGIAAMGVVMAAAAAAGVRSEGRSALFRGALLGFGLHGFGHLGMAAVARGYVSGAATAPTMVIPFWLWARRELARESITDVDARAVAVAAAGVPVTIGIHLLMYKLLRRRLTPR
jgi:hypothetical protein